jgi:hypothetical protein
MPLPLPSDFHAALSEDRLRAIAVRLLEVRHGTIRELSTELDDNYVRETAIFGRSRNMLIGMALNTQFPWLQLCNAALDVTAEIGSIPFRFFRDDPDRPEKVGFFRRNAFDGLFVPDDQAPVLWRFVVERAESEDAEDQVHFVGYNAYAEKVSQWILTDGAEGRLVGVDRDVPPSKNLPMADVELLPEPGDEEQDKAS